MRKEYLINIKKITGADSLLDLNLKLLESPGSIKVQPLDTSVRSDVETTLSIFDKQYSIKDKDESQIIVIEMRKREGD